jgi:LCP family protein required for cell wall assembly
VATRAASTLRHSAALAATLSFVFPGLGQGWAGARWRGVLLALPILVLVGFAAGTVMRQGWSRTAGMLLQPEVLIALIVLDVALLAYRAGAILDAFVLARRRWPSAARHAPRTAGSVLLAILLLATLGMHAGLGYIGYKTYDTITTVFNPVGTPEPTVVPTPGPSTTGPATPTAEPTPQPTPQPIWSDDGRLDMLLVGGDSGPGRLSLRTDTMILLSVDVASGRAAMFGIPRNLKNVPLPEGPAAAFPGCDCYPDLLNSLFVYAGEQPQLFRGGDARGYLALQDAVGEMTGLSLDGMLVVTLHGFVRLVDALGGVDINAPYALYDATYPHEDGTHAEEIYFPPGAQHLDGHRALAYARSRHQDTDYDRMWRQQHVLRALRTQVNPCSLVLRIPELLDIARDSLWTNLPVNQLPDLLALANHVRTDQITSHQFWPPTISESLDARSLTLIRDMVVDPWQPLPSATPRPSGAPTPTEDPGGFC